MKNSFSFITIDAQCLRWLKESVELSNENLISIEELKEELRRLESGEINNLILSVDENAIESKESLDILKFGQLTINIRNRTVEEGGRNIILTPKEFEILYFLAENRGTVFTKEQIYNAVWEEDYFLSDSNIMAFIRKLRKKLEPNPDNPIYILTIWGVGYKFNESC